jgi:hypothetical protein
MQALQGLQDSLRSAKFFEDLQDSARVSQDCKILQGPARRCKDLQDVVRICKILQRSARICKIMQTLQYGISSIPILQFSSRLCNSQQKIALLKQNLQIARFNKNLQYSSRYLIAQELKVLDVFTLTSSESFISLQFRNKRHVKKKIPFSFDAHIVNWLYAASTHFTAKAKALYR